MVWVTPSLRGSTSTTTASPSASVAETSSTVVASGRSSYVGTASLRPVSRSSSSRVAGLLGERDAHLVEGRRDEQVAGDDPRDEDLLLLRRAGAGQRQQAADQGLAEGQVERAGADLADEYGDLGQAQSLPAVLGRCGQAEQPRLGAGLPALADPSGPFSTTSVRTERISSTTSSLIGAPITAETVTCSSLGTARTTATGRPDRPTTGPTSKDARPCPSSAGASPAPAGRLPPPPGRRVRPHPPGRHPRRAAGWSSPAAGGPGSPSCRDRAGRTRDRAAARRRLHRDAHLVPGGARAREAVPRRRLRPALARSRHHLRELLGARLRRRRGRGDHRARAWASRSSRATRWARSSPSGCGASTRTWSAG